MSLHGSPRHFQFHGNFRVVAALQQQLDNLLFARTQPNSLLLHPTPPDFLHRLRPIRARLNLTDSHSTHIAILRHCLAVTGEHPFPQRLGGKDIAFEGWHERSKRPVSSVGSRVLRSISPELHEARAASQLLEESIISRLQGSSAGAVQVNTLDETSRQSRTLGTNYTIDRITLFSPPTPAKASS